MLRNVVRASGSFKLASGALQIGFIIIIIIYSNNPSVGEFGWPGAWLMTDSRAGGMTYSGQADRRMHRQPNHNLAALDCGL